MPAFYAHRNPVARASTNIVAYKGHTLQRAYAGESFFWGLLPQTGDRVRFAFERPIELRRFLFRSGNSEHPSDRLYNTTVEVLPVEAAASITGKALPDAGASANGTVAAPLWPYNITADGFLVVGAFDGFGVAEGQLDARVGRLREVRLHVHSDSENWAILSEVSAQWRRSVY